MTRWTQEDVDRYNRNFNKNRNFQKDGNKCESGPEISENRAIISKKENKYHNKKTEVNGIIFDSKREASRYLVLQTRLFAKDISSLQRQVRFHFRGKEGAVLFTYIADFVYLDNTGNRVVEDSKGFRTKEYRLKKKLIEDQFNLKIIET